MMSDGARIILRINIGNAKDVLSPKKFNNRSVCGLIGDFARAVGGYTSSYGNMTFVAVEGCTCNKPYEGNTACDIIPDDLFEWVSEYNSGSPCSCEMQTLMNFGCRCGGI